MKAVIVANTAKDDVANTWHRVKEYLNDTYGIPTLEIHGPNLQGTNLSVLATEEFDFVVALGGDGTIVAVGRAMQTNQRPIIGVNYGKLGFLAPFQFEDIFVFFPDWLAPMPKGSPALIQPISHRLMLRAQVFNAAGHVLFDEFAVNDCVLDIGPPFRALRYTIGIDGKSTPTIVGDGIIIATPTGSTAYNLSEMGPIVEPESGVFILTPKAAHKLSVRSFAVCQHNTVSVHLDDPEGAYVIVDGQINLALPREPLNIVVRDSGTALQLVRNSEFGFLDTLSHKLNWGM